MTKGETGPRKHNKTAKNASTRKEVAKPQVNMEKQNVAREIRELVGG
jgi:hypothetical protein